MAMHRSGVLRSSQDYSRVVAAFQGMWEPAARLLEAMRNRGLRVDSSLYNGVVQACGKGSAWRWATELLEWLPRINLSRYQRSLSLLTRAVQRDSQWERVVLSQSLSGGRKSRLSHEKLMAWHAAKKWATSLSLLSRRDTTEVAARNLHYWVLTNFLQGALWEKALSRFSDVRRDRCVDSDTYGALIGAFERGWQWTRAIDLLAMMRRQRDPPQSWHFNGVVSACWKGAQWQLVAELIQEMTDRGIPIDTIAYNSAIGAWVKGRHWQQAVDMLRRMQGDGRAPTRFTYQVLMRNAQCRLPMEVAMRLVSDMHQAGFEPDMARVLERHFGWRDALLQLEEMRKTLGRPDQSLARLAERLSLFRDDA